MLGVFFFEIANSPTASGIKGEASNKIFCRGGISSPFVFQTSVITAEAGI
jgi:hypothetical protein